MVRMNNLQGDEWDLNDIKHVPLGLREARRYRLKRGDLLFNRTNSKELVGKCGVFGERGVWVFASYLIRVRLDDERLLPEFASFFLNSDAGRIQIDRVSRQIAGMTNINAEELRELVVPLPSVKTQRDLVAVMDTARAARRAKLDEADSLLSSLDDYLLEKLGLARPLMDARRTFAARLSTANNSRFDPDYFHPERILTVRGMQQHAGRMRNAPLQTVVDFRRDPLASPGENYLSLAHVQSHTGELVEADETATGACFAFRAGDVLFGRLRPYLNKVHRAERDGCCSPEFHVMRVRPDVELLPDYLAAILRSSLTLAQTRHMMTGNTHPRLATDDVINLVIPIPDTATQTAIATEVRRRRERARALRAEAEAGWVEAKRWFEEQLLGPAA